MASSHTLEFDLLEVGTNSGIEIVPKQPTSDEPQLPLSTLPIGLPPLLPDPNEEFEEKLKCSKTLSVHHLDRVQRLLPRQWDVSSVYHTGVSALQTDIVVDRNPTTGELLGYKEAYVTDAGSSCKNSTSLSRAPGPPCQRVIGNSASIPFWPGGLEEPDLTALKSSGKQQQDESLDLENDLLEVAPAMSRGISFERRVLQRPTVSTPRPGGVIDLRDILAQDDVFDMDNDDGTVSGKEDSHTNVNHDDVQTKSDLPTGTVDDVIQLNARFEDEDGDMAAAVPTRDVTDGSGMQWAIKLDCKAPVDDFYKRIPDMAYKWPFELDIFQKQAILQLEQHHNVFVAAHTSAGKTVVAEYAIALSLKHMTRTIYTSPIKALSNQKFRDFKSTFDDVGLVTGDVQIHQEAACLVMTTEILRSMLYNGSDIIRDLEWVIFDEVHYINDAERGVVWEEVLIMLPKHVNIILLSATVPNSLEFAEWVGRTKKRQVFVVSTSKRPVPLEHHLYTGNSNKTSSELFMIVDSKKSFLQAGYVKAVEAKKERASKSSQGYGAKGFRGGNPHQDKGVWLSLIEMLRKRDKLPVVAFVFSKRRIEETAASLGSVDLLGERERSEVHIFFQHCIAKLKGSDRQLPQVQHMQNLLKRGIGLHHSGILPILKEVVEMLFQKGLVKVLFATETFAMGVNMPARTVVFDALRKHDGSALRDLLPGEYIQMAGRAGRRGLDSTGTVIILCKGDVQEMSELHKIMLGKPTLLQSQFRLTYTMMLNLLRVEQIRVEDMMKRSFSEFHNQKDANKYQQQIATLSRQIEQMPEVYDISGDLERYYAACREYWELKRDLMNQILGHPQAIKTLSAGRVVVLDSRKHSNALAVVLKSTYSARVRTFTVLTLCEQRSTSMDDSDAASALNCDNDDDCDWTLPRPVLTSTQYYQPEGACGQEVIDVTADDISAITTKVLKVNADRILDDVRKRQQPRFRRDPPGQSTSTTTQELLRIVEASTDGLPTIDAVKDLHLRDLDLVEDFQRLSLIENSFANYSCVHDPSFQDNFKQLGINMKTKDEFRKLNFKLSDESLQLLPEFQQRMNVLRALQYIDSSSNVQLKGRVACEISQHELIITELVFNNALTSLHPADIAALLSCVVFQQKHCSAPQLNPDLEKAKASFLAIARRIGETQRDCGLLMPVDDYVEQFHFGLLEVVFEWARGMPFAEITGLTDVQEGIIVRTIQRLDEVLRDIRNAARLIGDPVLHSKMQEASTSIKRDIVFAASLYTQ